MSETLYTTRIYTGDTFGKERSEGLPADVTICYVIMIGQEYTEAYFNNIQKDTSHYFPSSDQQTIVFYKL